MPSKEIAFLINDLLTHIQKTNESKYYKLLFDAMAPLWKSTANFIFILWWY